MHTILKAKLENIVLGCGLGVLLFFLPVRSIDGKYTIQPDDACILVQAYDKDTTRPIWGISVGIGPLDESSSPCFTFGEPEKNYAIGFYGTAEEIKEGKDRIIDIEAFEGTQGKYKQIKKAINFKELQTKKRGDTYQGFRVSIPYDKYFEECTELNGDKEECETKGVGLKVFLEKEKSPY